MDIDDSGALQPVHPGYRNVVRAHLAITWIPIVIAAIVLDLQLDGSSVRGLPSTLAPLLALIAIVIAPQRIYRRIGYRVGERLLQVVRGWMFHTDTIVPYVRVQHLDVKRGPVDKLFGTATLVIHTAGTHNSVVTVPGLTPERAAEIRDIIRQHVRTDFE
jgi:membrane protein YdbS with pleckstrin-like domain